MSYCRWSTDSYRCDLYCYEDVRGGWTTHVAGMRIVGDPPEEDMSLIFEGDDGAAKWMQQHKDLMEWMETAQHEPIGLAHDGETFNDPDLQSFKDRLLSLRAEGYSFPDGVLEVVDDEIAEAAHGQGCRVGGVT